MWSLVACGQVVYDLKSKVDAQFLFYFQLFNAGELLSSPSTQNTTAGRGWNFGWSGTSTYSWRISSANSAVLGFSGRTDHSRSASEQAQASIKDTTRPTYSFRYVSWFNVVPKVMVSWLKQIDVGSKAQEFYVGVDGDLDETANADHTFEGVSTSYTSLSSWANMEYYSSKSSVFHNVHPGWSQS